MRLMDVMTSPWAITPNMLQEIRAIYETHLRGDKIDIAGVEARLGRQLNNSATDMQIVDSVAVISANGPIAKRMNLFTEVSGGTSAEILANQIDAAMAVPNVKAVILSMDTPGGTVDGTFELAQHIFSLRGTKPIYTYADGMVASAGYAIGSATDGIFISGPATIIGSIGVISTHVDKSGAQQAAGQKATDIYSGKYKAIASSNAPLTVDGAAFMQNINDYLYTVFVDRVAQFRGVPVSTVLSDMADGQIFIGQQAIDAGLVDGVSTLEQMIAALSMGQMPTSNQSAGVAAKVETPLLSEPSMISDFASALAGVIDQRDSVLLQTNHEEIAMDITLAMIKEKYPDIAAALRAEGADTAKPVLAAEAATAERERIKAVMAQAMPGHEKLINALAFDGKTTGPEAAVQVLSAERGTRSATLADIKADTPAPVQHATEQDAPVPVTDEEKAKAAWDKDAKLQAEFSGNFASYLAYQTAVNKGQVKVLNQRTAA